MFASRLVLEKVGQRLREAVPLRLRRAGRPRRWSLRRAALGVDVHRSSLYLACVRPGWGRRWLLATGVIADGLELGSPELGARLREFLEPLGVEEPLVVLGLPRRDVIVRPLSLPPVAAKNLPTVLTFQLAAYKPNEEEEFCWDAAVAPARGRLTASLALLSRREVERFAGRFAEAGHPVHRLTLTQFSLLQLISHHRQAAAPRLLVAHFMGSAVELAALANRQLLYSRSCALEETGETAELVLADIRRALSALRWTDGEELLILLAGAPPQPLGSALAELGQVERLEDWWPAMELDGREAGDFCGAVALGLDGLSWAGSHRLNLLPRELRPPRRHWRHAPTYALLGANALLLLALGVRAPVQRTLILHTYREEIARLEQTTAEAEEVLAEQERDRQRLELLREFDLQAQQPLEVLRGIAERLPPDAWLSLFTYQRGQAEVVGSAKSASALLPVLQGSPQFEEAKFGGAVTRDPSGEERFRIQLRVKGSNP